MTSVTSESSIHSDANMVATLAQLLGESKVVTDDKVQFTKDIYAARREGVNGSPTIWEFVKSHTGRASTPIEALKPMPGDLNAQQVLEKGKEPVLKYLSMCVLMGQGGSSYKPQSPSSALPKPGIRTLEL